MKKEKQKNIRITRQEDKELTEIFKEINKYCTNKNNRFNLNNVISIFIKEYKETTPHGLKIYKEQLTQKLEIKKKEMVKLNDEITELKKQIKETENKINNIDKFDIVNYMHNPNVLKAIECLEEYKETHNKLYGNLKDIPFNQVQSIALNFGISANDLKKIIDYNY